MSQPATAPSMADNFFLTAMKPAFREDPYPFYERFAGPRRCCASPTRSGSPWVMPR